MSPSERSPQRPAPRRPATIVGILVAALAALVLMAPSAQAHSDLESITPADGASLEQAPADVVLTFSADVIGEFSQVAVKGPAGDLSLTAPTSAANVVTQALPAGLPAGTYTITYRIVSADSHPIAGQSTFAVTVGVATASPSAPAGTPSVSASIDASPSAEAPTPSASASPLIAPAATASGSSSPTWPWLLGAGVIAALVAAGVVVRRRRAG